MEIKDLSRTKRPQKRKIEDSYSKRESLNEEGHLYREKWKTMMNNFIHVKTTQNIAKTRQTYQKMKYNRGKSLKDGNNNFDHQKSFIQKIISKTPHIERYRNKNSSPDKDQPKSEIPNNSLPIQKYSTQKHFHDHQDHKNHVSRAYVRKKLLFLVKSYHLKHLKSIFIQYSNGLKYHNDWYSLVYRFKVRIYRDTFYKLKKAIFNEAISIIKQILMHNNLVPLRPIDLSTCYQKLLCFSVLDSLSYFSRQLLFNADQEKPLDLVFFDFSDVKTMNKNRMKRLVHSIVNNFMFTCDNSNVNKTTISEILQFLTIEDSLMSINLKNKKNMSVYNVSPKDPRIYVNNKIVGSVFDQILENIELPICQNICDAAICQDIVMFIDVFESFPYLKQQKNNFLQEFIQNDDKVFSDWESVNKATHTMMKNIRLPFQKNEPSDSTCFKIVENIDFWLFDDFRPNSFDKLDDFSSCDDRTFSLYSIVDEINNLIFEVSDIPIISNIPLKSQVEEIVNSVPVEFYDWFAFSQIHSIYNFSCLDVRVLISSNLINNIIQDSLSLIDYPIIINNVEDVDVISIAQMPIEDSIFQIPFIVPEPILNFNVINQQFFVNSKNVDKVVQSIFDNTDYPLIQNDVNEDDIAEILFDDFEDIYEFFGYIDIQHVIHILSTTEGKIVVKNEIVDTSLFECLNFINNNCLPIIINDVDDISTIEIISNINILDTFPSLNFNFNSLDSVNNFSCIDLRRYINLNYINKLLFLLYEEIDIPLSKNDILNEDIENISYFPIEDSFFVLPSTAPLMVNQYIVNDMRVYVNNCEIDSIINRCLKKLQLPIIPNCATDLEMRNLVNDENYDDVINIFSEINLIHLLELNPFERKINFDFPINEEKILNNIEYPIVLNDATQQDIKEILEEVLPFEFYDFCISGLDFIQRYEMPPFLLIDIEEFIEQIELDILYQELLSNLPLRRHIHIPSEITHEILNNFIDEESLLEFVVIFHSNPIKFYKAKEIPKIITLNDIVNNLLWNFILPILPVCHTSSEFGIHYDKNKKMSKSVNKKNKTINFNILSEFDYNSSSYEMQYINSSSISENSSPNKVIDLPTKKIQILSDDSQSFSDASMISSQIKNEILNSSDQFEEEDSGSC